MVSLPVYIMGLFLAKTLYQITIDKQEKKHGLYLCKGASIKQIKYWKYFESLIYSIPSGLLGILGGYIFNFYFLKMLLKDDFEVFIQEIGIIVTPFSIIFSIIVSILFSFIALTLPLKKLSQNSIASKIRKNIRSDEKDLISSKGDWFRIIIGFFPIIFTLFFTPTVILMMPWELRLVFLNISTIMVDGLQQVLSF